MHSNNFLMFTFQLDSLSCLGLFPILMIGKNCKGRIVEEFKYSLDFELPEDLEDKLKNVFENILRVYCGRAKREAPSTSSGQEGETPQAPSTSSGQEGETPQAPSTSSGQEEETPQAPSTSSGQEEETPQAPSTSSGQEEETPQAPSTSSGQEEKVPQAPSTSSGQEEKVPQAPSTSSGQEEKVPQAPSPPPGRKRRCPRPPPPPPGRKRRCPRPPRQDMETMSCEECDDKGKRGIFPYSRIMKKRGRKVLMEWQPCGTCKRTWEPTWEPKSSIAVKKRNGV
ncbi:unnamed protein product [Boreogadus saida]